MLAYACVGSIIYMCYLSVKCQIKCERYWSDEVGEAVEVEEADLTATTTSITKHRDFTIRTITLKKVHRHSYASSIFCMIATTFKDILVTYINGH